MDQPEPRMLSTEVFVAGVILVKFGAILGPASTTLKLPMSNEGDVCISLDSLSNSMRSRTYPKHSLAHLIPPPRRLQDFSKVVRDLIIGKRRAFCRRNGRKVFRYALYVSRKQQIKSGDKAPDNSDRRTRVVRLHYQPYYDLEALYGVVFCAIFNYFTAAIPNATTQGDASAKTTLQDDYISRSLASETLKLFNDKNVSGRTYIFYSAQELDNLMDDLASWGWSIELLKVCDPVTTFPMHLQKLRDELYLEFGRICETADVKAGGIENERSTVRMTCALKILKEYNEEVQKGEAEKGKESSEEIGP
ncbi:hypothetical protein BKA70DRAFT_1526134 [Coprinopsis sp. MPI-PUGE-AT-0042]|nr:hypothetical protein BKA70DRAFT_1526134 [Coprinopsis sp. MPI-PUGE-AT-0042]